jgi:hypothetical protein
MEKQRRWKANTLNYSVVVWESIPFDIWESPYIIKE